MVVDIDENSGVYVIYAIKSGLPQLLNTVAKMYFFKINTQESILTVKSNGAVRPIYSNFPTINIKI